ncbi:MAG: universal stress protein [Planctomycetes bacterium]|nr:universal stress protein [Planctomycetota bacterium]
MSPNPPHALPSAPVAAPAPGHDNHLRQLSPLLVWAVVFADIGTSVYYVPGVLYSDPRIRDLAPFFIGITLVGFVFLALKYIEICWRNPDGGGVVSIASQAISPGWGAFGGLLITISYFLTAAISTVSGLHYLGSLFPFIDQHIVLLTIGTLVVLAAVNIVGIRESATLSLFIAIAALLTNLLVVGCFLVNSTPEQWANLGSTLGQARSMSTETFLVGFGGAWLAFSGLESISQLSPAMKLPIAKTASRGMWLVIGTVLATSPILTLLAVSLLDPAIKDTSNERFISELGSQLGGTPVKIAVVVAASSLLLFAANTAIIGSYHVFLALAERHYMPGAIAVRNRRFKTPHVAILVATIVPMIVVIITAGDLAALAAMYAFGLMGAFVLSSFGLDVLRWRERRRGVTFVIGVFTTLLLYVAWTVGLFVNKEATLFGLFAVGIGMLLAIGTHQKWFTDWFYQFAFIRRRAENSIEEHEEGLELSEKVELLSLSQAEAIVPLYPSGTLVALRSHNPQLLSEAIARERGRGGVNLYALFVEERTGLFVGSDTPQIDREAAEALNQASKVAEREGFNLIPVCTVSYNAVEGIVRAADALGVSAVMVGVSSRSAIYHLLRGHVVNGLTKRLPSSVRLFLIS